MFLLIYSDYTNYVDPLRSLQFSYFLIVFYDFSLYMDLYFLYSILAVDFFIF
jgi:hypothetical protein